MFISQAMEARSIGPVEYVSSPPTRISGPVLERWFHTQTGTLVSRIILFLPICVLCLTLPLIIGGMMLTVIPTRMELFVKRKIIVRNIGKILVLSIYFLPTN
jgi:hypothetical protein